MKVYIHPEFSYLDSKQKSIRNTLEVKELLKPTKFLMLSILKEKHNVIESKSKTTQSRTYFLLLNLHKKLNFIHRSNHFSN